MKYVNRKQHLKLAAVIAGSMALLWTQHFLLPEPLRYPGALVILSLAMVVYFGWTAPDSHWSLSRALTVQLGVLVPLVAAVEHVFILHDIGDPAAWPRIGFVVGLALVMPWVGGLVWHLGRAVTKKKKSAVFAENDQRGEKP